MDPRIAKIMQLLVSDCFDVNLVDLIAATRGWSPLEAGETMTVHFQGNRYQITRAKEDEL